jgi:hypothetical protein
MSDKRFWPALGEWLRASIAGYGVTVPLCFFLFGYEKAEAMPVARRG